MARLLQPIIPKALYRFRSFDKKTDVVAREIDAIVNRYLYCSNFENMNDPMEGFYKPTQILKGRKDYKNAVEDIKGHKSQIGIACFTETFQKTLMWAHYAGNHAGICIAYKTSKLLDGLPNSVGLTRVAYNNNPPSLTTRDVSNIETAATIALSQKRANWAYEREWRIFASIGRVKIRSNDPISRIYFGSRVEAQHRHKLLQKIQGTGIRAYAMQINYYRQEFRPINEAARKYEINKVGADVEEDID